MWTGSVIEAERGRARRRCSRRCSGRPGATPPNSGSGTWPNTPASTSTVTSGKPSRPTATIGSRSSSRSFVAVSRSGGGAARPVSAVGRGQGDGGHRGSSWVRATKRSSRVGRSTRRSSGGRPTATRWAPTWASSGPGALDGDLGPVAGRRAVTPGQRRGAARTSRSASVKRTVVGAAEVGDDGGRRARRPPPGRGRGPRCGRRAARPPRRRGSRARRSCRRRGPGGRRPRCGGGRPGRGSGCSSSRNTSSGRPTRARATNSRWRSPPDSAAKGRRSRRLELPLVGQLVERPRARGAARRTGRSASPHPHAVGQGGVLELGCRCGGAAGRRPARVEAEHATPRRRRPGAGPGGSRPSWSCRRRWCRGGRTARPAARRRRRRAAPRWCRSAAGGRGPRRPVVARGGGGRGCGWPGRHGGHGPIVRPGRGGASAHGGYVGSPWGWGSTIPWS